MKLLYTILLIFLLGMHGYSQEDSKSKSILDKVSSTTNSYKTIKVEFKFTSNTDAQSGQQRVESGKMLLKGNKYHLTLSNSDVIFDGKSIYTYLKEPNEINITKPEPSKIEQGDFFFSNPKDIFKGYNKNFKSAFIKETNINKTTCFEIDLYPIDLKTKYSRIKMYIDKIKYQIIDVRLYLKDGSQHLLEFFNFVPNYDLDDKEFIFDTKKYPGAEVNDMRF